MDTKKNAFWVKTTKLQMKSEPRPTMKRVPSYKINFVLINYEYCLELLTHNFESKPHGPIRPKVVGN